MSNFAKDINVSNNDCISRQAAIDAANRADYTGLALEDVKKVTDEVVKEIKRLPSAQPEQRWIPVTERLPKENGDYLVTGRQGAVNKRRYEDGRWYGNWAVVAWMPLPEPYGKENCADWAEEATT